MEYEATLDVHNVDDDLAVEHYILVRYSDFCDVGLWCQVLALLALRLDVVECGSCSFVNFLRFDRVKKLVHPAYSRMSKAVVQRGQVLLGAQAFCTVFPTNSEVVVLTDQWNLRAIVERNVVVQLVSPTRSKTVLIAELKNERHIRVLENGAIERDDHVGVRKLEGSAANAFQTTVCRD